MQPAFNELDKKSLAYLLSLALIIATVPRGVSQAQEQQGAPAPTSSSAYSGQGAPQTPEELQNLVAPIALYPDALLAQILGAATFPDQIAVANYWAAAKQEPDGKRPGASRQPAIVGPEREGADAIPLGTQQLGPEPQLDLEIFSVYHTLSFFGARPTSPPTYPMGLGPTIGDVQTRSQNLSRTASAIQAFWVPMDTS